MSDSIGSKRALDFAENFSKKQKVDPREDRRTCCCGDKACEDLRKEVRQVIDSTHVWAKNNGFTEIRQRGKTFSLATEALRLCCNIHLNVGKSKQANTKYVVASIHWSKGLLQKKRNRTDPLTREEAKEFDAEANYSDAKYSDTGPNLIQNRIKEMDKTKLSVVDFEKQERELSMMFVQAPVHPRRSVELFVKSKKSDRGKREARRLSFASAMVATRSHDSTNNASESNEEPTGTEPDNMDIETSACQTNDSKPIPAAEVRADIDVPALTPPPKQTKIITTPDVFQEAKAPDYLRQKFNEMEGNVEQFCLDENVKRMARFYFIFGAGEETGLKLSDRAVMVRCPGCSTAAECDRFSIRKIATGKDTFCRGCIGYRKKEQQRERRKRQSLDAGIDRTDPASTVPMSYLSPETQGQRYTNLKKVSDSRGRKLERMHLRDPTEEDISFSTDDTNVIDVLTECLAHCKENSDEFRAEILKVLIETSKGYDVDPDDDEVMGELNDYTKELVSQLTNKSLRLSGKDKLVRFNARGLRSALGYWLQSPSNQDRMRQHGIEIMPSPSRLQKLQRVLIAAEGRFPEGYGWFQDERRAANASPDEPYQKVQIQIMFDEMNMTTLVCTNIKNKATLGFTASEGSNTIKLASEINRLVVSEEETEADYKDSKEIAKKVNLFRIRTIYGDTENVEFWYNAGSLTGDDLIEQLIRVILLSEITSLETYLIIADAGGPNSPLFTALRNDKKLEDKVWLDDSYVSFQHPFFPERRIAYCPCSVHGQKAGRNNIHKSQDKMTRNFVRHNIRWGWPQIKELRVEDSKNKPPRTLLTDQCIDPDRYSKMGVKEALAPFHFDTVNFACNQLADLLPNCDPKELILDSQIQNLGGSPTASSEGYEAERLDRCLEILKGKVKEIYGLPEYIEFVDDGTAAYYFARLNTVEYMVVMHGIFTARFLNTSAVLVKKHDGPRVKEVKGKKRMYLEIDNEKARMTNYLHCLEDWRKEALDLKARNIKDWEKTFISATTYKNLRLTVSGFLCYARLLLDLKGDGFYVPYAHANQSSIENIFSQVRDMGRDDAAGFAKAMLAIKAKRNLDTRSLKKGGMYDPSLVEATERSSSTTASGGDPSNIFNRRDNQRKERLDTWLEQRIQIKKSQSESQSLQSSQWQPANSNRVVPMIRPLSRKEAAKREKAKKPALRSIAEILEETDNLSNRSHFSEILFSDDDFCRIAKISIYGDAEAFFKTLCTLPSEVEERNFDGFCQNLYFWFAAEFDNMVNKPGTKKGMNRRMLELLQSSKYTNSIDKLILPALKCRLGLGTVVLTLQRHFLERVREIRLERLPEHGDIGDANTVGKKDTEIKLLVNRFVGFGLYRLIDDLKEKITVDASGDDEDELHCQLELARSMRIFHTEALSMPAYLDECYDKTQALKNNGYLALLSPQFFPFGEEMMAVVDKELNPSIFTKHGNNCLKIPDHAIGEKLPKLLASFQCCCSKGGEDGVSNKKKTEMVRYILSKTTHSYYKPLLNEFQQKTVKRKGKDHVPMGLRTKLRVVSSRKKKNAKAKDEEEDEDE